MTTTEILWRALAAQPTGTLSQLAEASGLRPDHLPAALDALVSQGVAVATEAGLYWCQHPPAPIVVDTLPAQWFEQAQVHFSLPSSQDRAAQLLRAGASRVLVVAEQQSAGRGRNGAPWLSPLGAHLYFSVGWRFALPASRLVGLSVRAGISLASALGSLGIPARLKWPNDLWLHDRKLGGVLIDLQDASADGCSAVIGIGLNHRMPHGQGPDRAWLDLFACMLQPPSRQQVLEALLTSLLAELEALTLAGETDWSAQFAAHDALAGRLLQYEEGGIWHWGQAEGIAPDGRLQVRNEAGLKLLASGEVRTLRTTGTAWCLLLDCGNTRLKWAWSALDSPLLVLRGRAVDLLTADGSRREAAAVVADLQSAIEELPAGGMPDLVRLASSYGGDRAVFLAALQDHFAVEVEVLQSPARWREWRSAYAEPERLGIDRTLAMWALLSQLAPGERALLVSVGSALTLDVLDADGRHLGGLIGPSPALSRQGLAGLSPRLDPAAATYQPLATRSNDAVWSASLLGAVGLIERVAREHAVQRVVLGGGGAGAVLALLRFDGLLQWLPDLPLWGLAGRE